MVTEKMIEAAARALLTATDASFAMLEAAEERRLLATARAALLAAEAAAWEGMETAPRDGTPKDRRCILVETSDPNMGKSVAVARFIDYGDGTGDFHVINTGRADGHRWRYIPTPPETSDE